MDYISDKPVPETIPAELPATNVDLTALRLAKTQELPAANVDLTALPLAEMQTAPAAPEVAPAPPAEEAAPQAAAETPLPIDLNDPKLYLNRELSQLEFQRRVLEEALDDPVLCRGRGPAIAELPGRRRRRLVQRRGDAVRR